MVLLHARTKESLKFASAWGYILLLAAVTQAMTTPIPPPPPISLPVWSLSAQTAALNDSSLPAGSMNIVTFCSAVSVSAPKLYVVSLYYDTLTKDSFLESGRGVLQLLRPSQKHLVPILGKRSGYDKSYSKDQECGSLGFPWTQDSLLPDCATYIHLKLVQTMPAGDHLLAMCEVVQTSQWDGNNCVPVPFSDDSVPESLDSSTVLYTEQLRSQGIL